MKVKVRYFALFRDQAGVASESIDWAGGTAAELFQAMADKHAALLPEAAALVAINDELSQAAWLLPKPEQLVFFTSVSRLATQSL